MENVEISSSRAFGPDMLIVGVCSRPVQKQEYLLTLVECAEGKGGGRGAACCLLHVDCGKRMREDKEGEKKRKEALQTHVLV
jgi:hypothetical protein